MSVESKFVMLNLLAVFFGVATLVAAWHQEGWYMTVCILGSLAVSIAKD